jgi:hypothetical protein
VAGRFAAEGQKRRYARALLGWSNGPVSKKPFDAAPFRELERLAKLLSWILGLLGTRRRPFSALHLFSR